MPSYRREVYDGSRGVGRMSDLLMRRGDNLAQLALRRGDIAAQNAQNIGGIIGQTAMSLAKQGEARRVQEAENARQAKADERQRIVQGREDTLWNQRQFEATKQGAESAAKSRALRQDKDGTWGYDMDVLASSLKDAGLGDRLPAIRASIAEIEDATLKHQAAKAGLDKATTDALARSARGVAIAARNGLDPVQTFSTEADRLVKNGVIGERDVAPYLEAVTKDPKAITGVLSQLMERGGLKLDDEDKSTAKPGSFEDYVGRVAREKGVKPEQLSPRDITAAKSAYDAAGRAPKSDGGDPGVTQSARNTATRWRDSQFATIDADAKREIQREADRLRQGGGVPLTDAEFTAQARPQLEKFKRYIYDAAEQKKRDVVRSYQDQLGGEVGPAPVARTEPTPVPAAPRPAMSDVRPMRSNAAPAPASPSAPGVPAVGSIVTRRGVRYRIEQINPDGTVKATPLE